MAAAALALIPPATTDHRSFSRTDCAFDSHGTRCQGYLYRPATANGRQPCVVMAHGFGATREHGLAPFAEAFAAAGYAVFLFDYRGFGASAGSPRNVLVPRREVDDWLAAIDFVRSLEGIDPGAIALWGTSFAGGLVTQAAARDGRVQAVIAQCPLMDGLAAVQEALRYAGLKHVLRLSAHATLDITRALFGLSPHTIAAAARPGGLAAMTAADCYDGYVALAPQVPMAKVSARVIALLMFHRPVLAAKRVPCPVLVQICERDTVAPVAAAERAARRMARAVVRRYDLGHFDIYQGAARERSIGDQLAFLREHLPVAA